MQARYQMKKTLLAVLALPFLLIGCDKEADKEIGYGTIDDGVYTNDYFDLSIAVPEDWSVQSRAAQQALMDTGTGLIAGDDENLKSVLTESQKQTVNMFAFFKHEQGAPVEFNPSLIAVAERVSGMPGIKKGSDYLFHVRKLLKGSQMTYEFPNDVYSQDLSGVLFDVMPTQLIIGDMTIHQQHYATRMDDYILGLILSYSSESELDELHAHLEELSFSGDI